MTCRSLTVTAGGIFSIIMEPNVTEHRSSWRHRLLVTLGQRFGSARNANETRLRRRRALVSLLTRRLRWLRFLYFSPQTAFMHLITAMQSGTILYRLCMDVNHSLALPWPRNIHRRERAPARSGVLAHPDVIRFLAQRTMLGEYILELGGCPCGR